MGLTIQFKKMYYNRKYYWDAYESDSPGYDRREWVKATGYNKKTGDRIKIYVTPFNDFTYVFDRQIIHDGKLILKTFSKLKVLDLDNNPHRQAWLSEVKDRWTAIDSAMNDLK